MGAGVLIAMSVVPAPPAPVPAGVLPATGTTKEGRVFTVRAYRDEDRTELERFYAAFEPKRAAQGLPPEGEMRIRRWLDGVLPQGTHLVVEMGNAMVGHAMLMPTATPETREYAIFLDQTVRGQGMGTQVNRVTVDVARTLRLSRLWLSVEPHNRPAVRSYQKAGFQFRPHTLLSPELEMEMAL